MVDQLVAWLHRPLGLVIINQMNTFIHSFFFSKVVRKSNNNNFILKGVVYLSRHFSEENI